MAPMFPSFRSTWSPDPSSQGGREPEPPELSESRIFGFPKSPNLQISPSPCWSAFILDDWHAPWVSLLKLCSPEPVGRRRGCGGDAPARDQSWAAEGRSVPVWFRFGASTGLAFLVVLVVNGAKRRGEWTQCGLFLTRSPPPPPALRGSLPSSCGLLHAAVAPALKGVPLSVTR